MKAIITWAKEARRDRGLGLFGGMSTILAFSCGLFASSLMFDVTLTLDMHNAAYMIAIHRHSNIEELPPFTNAMMALM